MSLVGAGGGSGLYPEGTYRPGIRVRLTADSVPASAGLQESAASTVLLSSVCIGRFVKHR